MKIAVIIVRSFLGLAFTVFGLNMFFHFMDPKEPPPGDMGAIATLMATHHWMDFVGACMLIGGLCLLTARFVPLGLTLLAAIIYNILAFHIAFDLKSIVPGVICALLEAFLLYAYRDSFRPLFTARAQPRLN